MYTDGSISLKSEYSSLPEVGVAEILEAALNVADIFSETSQDLARQEFEFLYVGKEGVSDWIKSAQANFRKLFEGLKMLATKIFSFLKTIPERIIGLFKKITIYIEKSGLLQKVNNLSKNKENFILDREKLKDFSTTEFGPLNFVAIKLKASGADIPSTAEKAANFIVEFFQKIFKKKEFQDAMQAKKEDAENAGVKEGSDIGGSIAKISLIDYINNDSEAKKYFDAIDEVAERLGEYSKYNESDITPDKIHEKVMTLQNGASVKAAKNVITGINRAKIVIDGESKLLSGRFNAAYSKKDREAVSAIMGALKACRECYSELIKITVRTNTAAQRCASNTLLWIKAALACYVPKKGEEKKETEAKPAEENKKPNEENKNENWAASDKTSSKGQDFSKIFG
jgi:hypothetical protein